MAYNGHMPNVELYWRLVIGLLALFGVFDFAVARHTKARYFAIHVLANSIVVVAVVPGCVRLMSNPAAGLLSDDFSALAIAANLSIHVYHVIAFRNLTWIDWLHHSVTFFALQITFALDDFFGLTCDMQNFFGCGLPGGLDYAMLFAVKYGWMSPLDEKRYNATLNTWLRGPGMVFSVGLAYAQLFMKDPTMSFADPAFYLHSLMLSLFIWNGQYFSARVIGNYHVRQYQEDQKQKTASLAPSS